MRRKVLTLAIGVLLVAFISCKGKEEEESKTETDEAKQEVIHNEEEAKAPPPINHELAEKGEKLFQTKGCSACHTIGQGKRTGPDLAGVTERRNLDWIANQILHPEAMLEKDPIARELLATYMVRMPNQNVTPEEAQAIIMYFREKDSKAKEEPEHEEKD